MAGVREITAGELIKVCVLHYPCSDTKKLKFMLKVIDD